MLGGEDQLVPANALQRTFQVAYGDAAGTAFTIDVDGRQYLVTAKHLLEKSLGPIETIQIWHSDQWKALSCQLVGLASGEIDVAVLAPAQQLSPTHPLIPSHAGLHLSQDAYFLGFPFGYRAEIGAVNNDFPLPLVKRACVSLMALHGPGDHFILLDGHNNEGFSGGPVVFAKSGEERGGTVNVVAVVSSYRSYLSPVLEADGKTETTMRVEDNSGIVEAYSIEYAVELIARKPLGPLVRTD